MADVYLASLVRNNLRLSLLVRDHIASGVIKCPPDRKLNPKNMERLFNSQGMLDS